jgi:acyl carrier protein|tara:strand:+ start:1795 stop:2016 length:222 start_codon:yes stop_codon:yes gene_type:complete
MKPVENIIAEHLKLDVSEVTDEKHIIDDLGADSLHTVELVMEFENEYDMSIPDEDAETLDTVGKIKEYIAEYA